MSRNFSKVLKDIKAVGHKELNSKLKTSVPFWAPEVVWYNLSKYVNKYVVPDSTDDTSVSIYAILCGCSKEEMIEKFRANGD